MGELCSIIHNSTHRGYNNITKAIILVTTDTSSTNQTNKKLHFLCESLSGFVFTSLCDDLKWRGFEPWLEFSSFQGLLLGRSVDSSVDLVLVCYSP